MERILSKKNDRYYHFLSRITQIEQTGLAKRFLYELHRRTQFPMGSQVRSPIEQESKNSIEQTINLLKKES